MRQQIYWKRSYVIPKMIGYFYLAEAFRRGYSLQQTHDLTKISPYFLDIVKHLVELEDDLSTKPFDAETLMTGKNMVLA